MIESTEAEELATLAMVVGQCQPPRNWLERAASIARSYIDADAGAIGRAWLNLEQPTADRMSVLRARAVLRLVAGETVRLRDEQAGKAKP